MQKATNLLIISLLILLCCSCSVETPAQIPAPPPPSPPPPVLPTLDTTPPETIIISTPSETVGNGEITFEWTGSDDKTLTASLIYSYFLEGYDITYSLFTSATSKTYNDLPPGSYSFYVKSKDEAGNIATAIKTEITIATAPQKDEAPSPVVSSLLTLPNSEVNRIAIGSYGNVTYALDSINAQLYKSDHGGYGWDNISGDISGTATWDSLAIAPDNPDIIAVTTDSGTEIYLSVDGGANFFSTQLSSKISAGERVKCIDISPSYGRNTLELAAGTSTGNGGGKVWINIINHLPSGWQDCSTSTNGWLPPSHPTSGVDIFAIEYSPAFASDGTLLAITASGPASNTGDTYLYIGTRDLASNNTLWNRSPGYPVEICQSGQDTPGTPLTYADLALPSDYAGASISQRHVYVCWSDNAPGVATSGNNNDDVYRLDDAICYRLQFRPDIICSLAHHGSYSHGKLLAGAMMSKQTSRASTQAYCTFNPHSPYPAWQQSQKPPTGPNNAQVAWSTDGKVAYCGTSSIGGAGYDQSAFSRSTNNGLTWNQIGLIDT